MGNKKSNKSKRLRASTDKLRSIGGGMGYLTVVSAQQDQCFGSTGDKTFLTVSSDPIDNNYPDSGQSRSKAPPLSL
jgi:hypothetical protein